MCQWQITDLTILNKKYQDNHNPISTCCIVQLSPHQMLPERMVLDHPWLATLDRGFADSI